MPYYKNQAMDERKAARQALLQQIEESLKADDRFLAAWLVGSMSRHADDGLSDIDIIVVVDTKYFPLLCQRPWIVAGRTTDERLKFFEQFGDPILIHENHNNAPGEGTFTSVTYRADVLTVDWTLVTQENAILPGFYTTLFSKVELPIHKPKSFEAQEQRAKAASEKVAFFWMMITIAIKNMLWRDIVYFHMLLDGLHRTLIEVTYLVEGQAWLYRSGSQVQTAITQREQRAAIQAIAAQMQALMPKVIALGGYVPNDPMFAVDYLLNLSPIDDVPIDNALVAITEADREKVKLIIEALNGHIGKRIGMYIGSNDPGTFYTFLNGFHFGGGILGVSQNRDEYWKVVVERGWRYSPRAPYEEMQERGMDNDAIIAEMIAIEVETWKRSYNITNYPKEKE